MDRRIAVGVLGHWGGNIGHDLMALGVEEVARAAFGPNVQLHRIEQHHPMDIYSPRNPLRRAPFLRHGRGGTVGGWAKRIVNSRLIAHQLWRYARIGHLDVAVACGGPLIAPQVARRDLQLMYQHVFSAFRAHEVPVLNLSVGSCFPLERIDAARREVSDAESSDFLREVFAASTQTTVRDELAQRLCAELGQMCELVCDTGFVGGIGLERLASSPQRRQYVVVNYQRLGANEDWGQGVDEGAWRSTISALVGRVSKRIEVVFVCHSDEEVALARSIAPGAECHQPRTMEEYANLVTNAVAGVSNRVHAGVALASVGVPCIGVGTDSRLGTLEALGLRCMYVKEASADVLEEAVGTLIEGRDGHRERLLSLRARTLDRYAKIMSAAVSP